MKGFKHFIPQHPLREMNIYTNMLTNDWYEEIWKKFHNAMNQANPISSNLRILSAFMEVLVPPPSEYFLYSARWVDTQRPRAVLPLYLVGTWQLPYLALYTLSSFYFLYESEKKNQWLGSEWANKRWVCVCQQVLTNHIIIGILTNFSSQLACPFRFAQRKPTAWRRSYRESVREDVFPSKRFFCSIRCYLVGEKTQMFG